MLLVSVLSPDRAIAISYSFTRPPAVGSWVQPTEEVVGMANAVSIGCGSADAADRLDWPVELADSGLCSYMAFDSLAERTLGFAHAAKMENPSLGYNSRLPKTV